MLKEGIGLYRLIADSVEIGLLPEVRDKILYLDRSDRRAVTPDGDVRAAVVEEHISEACQLLCAAAVDHSSALAFVVDSEDHLVGDTVVEL